MIGRRAPSAGRAAAGMVLATLLWGATFVVVRDTLVAVAPAPLVALRFGAASLLFALVLALRGRRLDRSTLVGGAVSGVLAAGSYLFQAIGLMTTSAGSSAFLTAAGTLLSAFFAWPLLGQRPPAVLSAGIALALAGSALLSVRGDFRVGPGEAWTLVGAAVYALQIVAVAHWLPRADVIGLTAVQAWAVTLILVPFTLKDLDQVARLDGAAWWRVGYLVVAGTVAAPWLQVVAQRALPPGRIGLLFALEPVFGLGFAVWLGGERFVLRWWAGAALILFAVCLVEGWAAWRAAARSLPATP